MFHPKLTQHNIYTHRLGPSYDNIKNSCIILARPTYGSALLKKEKNRKHRKLILGHFYKATSFGRYQSQRKVCVPQEHNLQIPLTLPAKRLLFGTQAKINWHMILWYYDSEKCKNILLYLRDFVVCPFIPFMKRAKLDGSMIMVLIGVLGVLYIW